MCDRFQFNVLNPKSIFRMQETVANEIKLVFVLYFLKTFFIPTKNCLVLLYSLLSEEKKNYL